MHSRKSSSKRQPLLVTAVFVVAGITAVWSLLIVHAATTTVATGSSSLQEQIDADNQQITVLNQQIAEYQAQLQQIGTDKKTLQAAINALDLQRSKVQAQVTVTERQINTTQLQIQQLGGEIADTEQSIAADQEALGAYLRTPEDRRPTAYHAASRP